MEGEHMKVVLINRDTNENVTFKDVEMVNIFDNVFNHSMIYIVTKKMCHKYNMNEWEMNIE